MLRQLNAFFANVPSGFLTQIVRRYLKMKTASNILFENFEIVQSEDDRRAVFTELESSTMPIAVVTEDELTFIFLFDKSDGAFIHLLSVESPRQLVMNETGLIVFSISTGQYALRSSLKILKNSSAAFLRTAELRRLQRRTNFRVSTKGTKSLKATVPEFHLKVKTLSTEVLDISVGGLILLVITNKALNLNLGDSFICVLTHPSRSIDGLRASIRHIDKSDTEIRLGIEFLNPSNEQRQSLLALSLQMHRERLTILDT